MNRGVSERHASDLAEARDGAQSDINITASLTKKAAQYAQLNGVTACAFKRAVQLVAAGASMDDHNNHCLVDFEYKQLYGMPGQVTHSLMCIIMLLLRLVLAVTGANGWQDAHVGPEPASEQQALAAALRSGAAQEPTTDECLISSMISGTEPARLTVMYRTCEG